MLGCVFGLLRGVVVLGLLVILCHAVRLHDEPWYRNSTLMPYAEHAGNVLRAAGRREYSARLFGDRLKAYVWHCRHRRHQSGQPAAV